MAKVLTKQDTPEYEHPRSSQGFDACLSAAERTFGNGTDAVRWMSDNCPALGARPIDLIETPEGLEAVTTVLGCIDYGMIY